MRQDRHTLAALDAFNHNHDLLGLIYRLVLTKQAVSVSAKVIDVLHGIIVGSLDVVELAQAQPLRKNEPGSVRGQRGSCVEVGGRSAQVMEVDVAQRGARDQRGEQRRGDEAGGELHDGGNGDRRWKASRWWQMDIELEVIDGGDGGIGETLGRGDRVATGG